MVVIQELMKIWVRKVGSCWGGKEVVAMDIAPSVVSVFISSVVGFRSKGFLY